MHTSELKDIRERKEKNAFFLKNPRRMQGMFQGSKEYIHLFFFFLVFVLIIF